MQSKFVLNIIKIAFVPNEIFICPSTIVSKTRLGRSPSKCNSRANANPTECFPPQGHTIADACKKTHGTSSAIQIRMWQASGCFKNNLRESIPVLGCYRFLATALDIVGNRKVHIPQAKTLLSAWPSVREKSRGKCYSLNSNSNFQCDGKRKIVPLIYGIKIITFAGRGDVGVGCFGRLCWNQGVCNQLFTITTAFGNFSAKIQTNETNETC